MERTEQQGEHIVIGKNVRLIKGVSIGKNYISEDDVAIGDKAYIDNNTIIRSVVKIRDNAFLV